MSYSRMFPMAHTLRGIAMDWDSVDKSEWSQVALGERHICRKKSINLSHYEMASFFRKDIISHSEEMK